MKTRLSVSQSSFRDTLHLVLSDRRASYCVMFLGQRTISELTEELCKSRGGGPGLPVPNSHYGLCGRKATLIVQELCESRGGRPGHSVLTSLLVSVDVKNY